MTNKLHDHQHTESNKAPKEGPQLSLAHIATLHCLLGCGIGEVIGVIIGTLPATLQHSP